MKYSGVEWIGNIPDSWNLVRFKDLYKNIKEIAGEKSSNYERLALTLNGVIKRKKDDSEGLQPKEFDTYQILNENDFVFKMIDLQNISTSRVGLTPYTGLVSPAYLRFSPKYKEQYSKFIYYFFMSMYYNCVFNSLGGNGVRSALNANDMGNLICPLPEENVQRKIVSFIEKKCSEIDELIEVEKKQIESLMDFKQSLIDNSFSKFCNWKLKYLTDGICDGTHGTFSRVESGRYLLSAKNLGDKSLIFSDSESMISEDDYISIIKNGFPSKNDILICCVGDVGKTIIYDYDEVYAFQRSVMFIRPSDKVLPRFLMYALMTTYVRVQETKLANKTIQAGLYQGLVKELKIPFVNNFAEQIQVCENLDEKRSIIDELIELKNKKNDELKEYKKSLIYEYVTGKKEVDA